LASPAACAKKTSLGLVLTAGRFSEGKFIVDAALEKRQVKRAYKLYAPAYDFVFDWIFHPGREAAIRLLGAERGHHILEVGIGTGLNLPLYPHQCRITGIDLSEEMLEKAEEKVAELALGNVTLRSMDATVMDFPEDNFDAALATYTISAVPDPVGVLREMRRVVKPGGSLVLLNHFRSERRVVGRFEDLVAPVCTRLGWKSNLPLEPLLEQVGLSPEISTKVNLFHGWRLIKCVNRK
jgi:phosphatidylethanolamine/phosphatidyl-N-methylethanolamine N-methyltransferase